MSKGSIVRTARKTVETRWPDVNPSAACLYLSMAALEAAKADGVLLTLYAGTFHWCRVPDHLDDGVMNTHFGYVWEQPSVDEAWNCVLANGYLPEMHVWAADPKRQQIVDLSTGSLPEACLRTTRQEWLSQAPPDFVWEHIRELPKDGAWDPVQTATDFVRELVLAVTDGKIRLDGSGMAEAHLVRRFAGRG